MIWLKRISITGARVISQKHFLEGVELGLLMYHSKGSILNILGTENYDPLCEGLGNMSHEYYVFSKNIYLSFGNEIRFLDIENCFLSELCQSDKGSVVLINDSVYKEFIRDKNTSNFRSIDNGTVMMSISGMVRVLANDDSFMLVQNKQKVISCYCKTTFQLLWETKLDDGSFGGRYYGESEDCYFLQRVVSSPEHINVLSINKKTGKIQWEIEKVFTRYSYCDKSKRLYGLAGDHYHIINTLTGEFELQKKVDAPIWVSANLVSIYDNCLYFSSLLEDKVPGFGALSLDTGDVLFTQKVETGYANSSRGGLGYPYLHDNRLYIRDAEKTMHIFERQDV